MTRGNSRLRLGSMIVVFSLGSVSSSLGNPLTHELKALSLSLSEPISNIQHMCAFEGSFEVGH